MSHITESLVALFTDAVIELHRRNGYVSQEVVQRLAWSIYQCQKPSVLLECQVGRSAESINGPWYFIRPFDVRVPLSVQPEDCGPLGQLFPLPDGGRLFVLPNTHSRASECRIALADKVKV